jgi:predicted AAA+ superfamily ATPase
MQSAPSVTLVSCLLVKIFLPIVTLLPTVTLVSGLSRNAVIVNTKRFIEGKNANNILLYGDRGTGKSATVKAVCNEFADQGLRLIEVRKDGVQYLPSLMEEIAGRGLRFVIFIDDLSFERADDSFTGLKALLEGGIEARPANAVIYATSNRRHFVKERFSDRPANADGDPRAFDTMQEQLSLSDRFGLTIVFTAPDQDEFLSIAEKIAETRGLFCKTEEERKKFHENAIRWERWFNGRSPRAAVQFVDWISGGEGFPWE